MIYETACYGRVELGTLPGRIQERLLPMSGEWLEFEPTTGSVVVRLIQPSAGPSLPTIASELLTMLALIPSELQAGVPGGEIFIHTEAAGRFVRLRVARGGSVHVEWAHADYRQAQTQPYGGDVPGIADPKVQRLNGKVTFRASDPARAACELERLADTYEGLYPEGECGVRVDKAKRTLALEMHDLNLDGQLLIAKLEELSEPGTLAGGFEVTSFATHAPEQTARFVFRRGKALVQRPNLWPEAEEAEHSTCRGKGRACA